ncbi:MAG: deoxyribodipyrimidine photo-lyase [Pseudomonadota bacterium]
MWFRNDLRLADNPALHAAAQAGPVICVYVFEEDPAAARPLGGAAKWWLDKSLARLSEQIASKGGGLIIRRGAARAIVPDLAAECGASGVYWNRRYEARERDTDAHVKSALKAQDRTAESFNGSLLTEPWTVKTKSGGHYRVFTPYWKALLSDYVAPPPLGAPEKLSASDLSSLSIDDLSLHPTSPDWSVEFSDAWTPGEAAALDRLEAFLDGPVSNYGTDRNRPDLDQSSSGLSPHLRFGEVSPVTIWRAVRSRIDTGEIGAKDAMKFLSEVAWREFSYVLLFNEEDLEKVNYNRTFDEMAWRRGDDEFRAWSTGMTGYPMVDAGMRQLWRTGWMHNRVRMITASFLTKHLLIDWRRGEKWFWDTLVDADPASNPASWQWTAGSGADAAPYFRVFNPITQGQKFDETGAYVRHWCPELAKLPLEYLHAPWEAPEDVLDAAGVRLGETYPRPVIDHADGRARALAAYEALKTKQDAA